jgi:hypothetical protein
MQSPRQLDSVYVFDNKGHPAFPRARALSTSWPRCPPPNTRTRLASAADSQTDAKNSYFYPRPAPNDGKLVELHLDERKEPMKIFSIPGDPKASAVILPGVSRS